MKTNSYLRPLAIFGLLASTFAFAQGDKAGGGAHFLECRENGKIDYWLLDFREAKQENVFTQLGNDATTSIEDMIGKAASFYAVIDPVRASKYASEALEMYEDIQFLEAEFKTNPKKY